MRTKSFRIHKRPQKIDPNKSVDEIVKELKKITFDKRHRENMITAFRMIKGQFAEKKPSERVAEIVMEMAGRR